MLSFGRPIVLGVRAAAIVAALCGFDSRALPNVAWPFEYAATKAPLILLVRSTAVEQDHFNLEVLEQIKGAVAGRSILVKRPDWFYRPLKVGGVYVVLLAEDLRPYVGGVTPDADPANQAPAYACGVINVLEIVDGVMRDFYQFMKRPDGKPMRYEDLRALLRSTK